MLRATKCYRCGMEVYAQYRCGEHYLCSQCVASSNRQTGAEAMERAKCRSEQINWTHCDLCWQRFICWTER